MMKHWHILGCLLVLATGCMPVVEVAKPNVNIEPARPEPPPDPQLKPVDINALVFSAPDVKHRFQALDKITREFVDGKGFEHRPYELGGNFVTAVWAKNTSFTLPTMLKGPRESFKDIHRISVETIVIGFPNARSASVNAETVSADPEKWCVNVHYREGAPQPVTGAGWGILFYRWDPAKLGTVPFRPYDQAKERISLPLDGYSVAATGVPLEKKREMHEDFLRHARSATSLRDVYLEDMARLEKDVIAFIEAHKARKRIFESSHRSNLPPKERSEPLTEQEEKAELAKAKKYFADQSELMRNHHVALHAAMLEAFPLQRVWLELKNRE